MDEASRPAEEWSRNVAANPPERSPHHLALQKLNNTDKDQYFTCQSHIADFKNTNRSEIPHIMVINPESR
ncbi:MAG: hypothetical protein ACK5JR_07360 [Tropicimonas sp.]|uniref:hypothetical protein n=1 Tax=Tropicimonas sp. TaxID=2067044 RepID=UPI003A8553D3